MGLRTIFRKAVKKALGKREEESYFRDDFIRSMPADIQTLEIGPFFTPAFRGKNIKYFDVQSREDLVKRALDLNPDFEVENIPHIDYVSPTADLTVINEKFDAVYSSHVIEHQFDLVDHLQKTSTLLDEGGKYYLVVPDKRYCFDHFQQLSTIADVLLAHYEKRKKHSLKSLIEYYCFTTHNDPVEHWKGNHGQVSNSIQKIKEAISRFEGSEFEDSHAFFFTPETFLEIMNTLYEMEYINFKVERLQETCRNNNEFYCVLQKVLMTGRT